MRRKIPSMAHLFVIPFACMRTTSDYPAGGRGIEMEFEVIWDGRESLEKFGLGAIERRGSYLLDQAPSKGPQGGDFPRRVGRPGGVPRRLCEVGCGRAAGGGYRRCKACRKAGRGSKRAA